MQHATYCVAVRALCTCDCHTIHGCLMPLLMATSRLQMIEHSFDRNVLVSTMHSSELNATCINANNTHATVHATCDCDVRHAMHATVTAWLAVSMRLRLRHATSDGRHEACKHECVIDGGGMGVHVPQSIRFANRWPCCTLDSDSFRDASARVPSLPTQQPISRSVKC